MLASRGKVAIPIAMSVPGQMPLAEAKNRLSEVVDRLEREHGHVIITKHRRPAAVVISVEDLQSLEETLDIMNSAAPARACCICTTAARHAAGEENTAKVRGGGAGDAARNCGACLAGRGAGTGADGHPLRGGGADRGWWAWRCTGPPGWRRPATGGRCWCRMRRLRWCGTGCRRA